jgi:predicted glycosyltransferase
VVKERFFHPLFTKPCHILRIWFDILTPKQVMFFGSAATLLHDYGHELLYTSRHYREAEGLAKVKSLKLEIVGRHGGASRYQKLRESAKRIFELADLINKFEPDLAITFCSPEASRVAFGLGVRHIAFNDSPHASAVSRISLPLVDHLFSPWVIPVHEWLPFGISKAKITHYRALDPAAWLKQENWQSKLQPNIQAARTDVCREKKILIRPEETNASYIADKNFKNRISMIDSVVDRFHKTNQIVILGRYDEQVRQFAKRYVGKAEILDEVIDGITLLSSSDVFIGAGGTMTTEASLLGIPTISISPFRFHVERYLVNSGLAMRATDQNNLVRLTNKMLTDEDFIVRHMKLAKRILNRMEHPLHKMISYLRLNA